MQGVIIKKNVRILLVLENTRVTDEKKIWRGKIIEFMSFWHEFYHRKDKLNHPTCRRWKKATANARMPAV
jgi:hypothetical protein